MKSKARVTGPEYGANSSGGKLRDRERHVAFLQTTSSTLTTQQLPNNHVLASRLHSSFRNRKMSVLQSQASGSGFLSTIAANPILLVALPVLVTLVISLRSYLWLSHIPGPFFAKFTNIPRLLWVKSYHAHKTHVELHKRYGPIVRFGPNMVSVGDPKEIGTIYSFKQPWRKVSEMQEYSCIHPMSGKGVVSLRVTNEKTKARN